MLLRGLIGLVIRSSGALFKSQSDQSTATPPPPHTHVVLSQDASNISFYHIKMLSGLIKTTRAYG